MLIDTLAFETITLPKPYEQGGASLFASLQQRRTTRDISMRSLPVALLSNLLWAACGVNRPVGPFGAAGRTAASASNSQEIAVYVAIGIGVFRYEPDDHALIPVAAGNWSGLAMTPRQGLPATAPVHLIYVADIHRLTHTIGFDEPGLHDSEVQKSYYFVDTGLIAGNVHLFAAAHGLAAWFHNCDKDGLAICLRLGTDQRALFAQSVGYPA